MKRKARLRAISRAALAITEGLFSKSVDLGLWYAVYCAYLFEPFETYGKGWKAAASADRFLHQVNYEVIKHAIITAKRYGFIKKSRRHAWPEITRDGKRRLAAVVPHYDSARTWDGRMHLITYDILEQRRNDRELLREYLQRIGCGRLQDSVWMTPYNPIDTLRSFIEKHDLQGSVIISDLGKDGSIGEEDIHRLVARLYRLEEVNQRYEEWLADAAENGIDQWAVIKYLAILRDDPQLPFDLLPSWWKGDKAYLKVKSLLQKLPIL